MSARIDQPKSPKGRSRCKHDMLDGECSWCRGLADVPIIDLPLEDAPGRVRWVQVERHGQICAGCDTPLRVGVQAAWSAEHSALVCSDCAEVVE